MAEDQQIRMTLRTDLPEKGAESRKAMASLKDEIADTASVAAAASGKVDAAAGSTMNLGYAGLTAGRALQDFTQGGIGGILNNIEGMTMALGGTGGMAGLLTAVGVAAFIAKPYVTSFVAGVMDGSNEVPKAADALKEMEGRLKDVGKRLDELHDKQTITNSELEEYNRLSAEQVELEKAKNVEAQRKKDIESYDKIQPAAEVSAEKGGAKQLQTLLGTSKEDIENAVAEGLRQGAGAEYYRLQKQANEQTYGSDEQKATMGRMAELRPRMADSPDALEANLKESRDLLARGAQGGNADVMNRIVQLAGQAQGPDALSPIMRGALGQITPEGQDAARERAAQYARQQKAQDEDRQRTIAAADESRADAERQKARNEKAQAESNRVGMEEQRMMEEFQKQFKKKQQAASAKSNDDEFEAWLEDAKKEQQAKKRDERPVTSEEMYRDAIARQIQQQNGVSPGAAEGAARRSIELQKEGFNVMTAQAEATQEMMAALAGNWQYLQQLQTRVEAQVQWARQMNQATREQRQTFSPWGR